jgi:DNA (cytosine-5)-methyltransferase 1
MVAVLHSEISPALKARDHKGPSSDGDGDGAILVPMQPSYGIPGNWIGRKPENGGNATEPMYDIALCLTSADQHGVAQPIAFDAYNQTTSDTVTAWRCAAGGVFDNTVAQPIAFSGQMSNPQTDVDMTQTLGAKNPMAVAVGAFKPGQSASAHSIGYESEMAPTLEAGEGGNNKPAVHVGMAVRRLTPVECERFQGFGDNYTDIKPNGKATPDGPRYKALGNSMAVPVMAWIGKRIQEVDAICKTQQNT